MSINVYTLQGGAVVCDKTGGIAKAAYSNQYAKHFKIEKTYEVSINGTPINVVFKNSHSITFKMKGDIVKITELDNTGRDVYYVDTKGKPVLMNLIDSAIDSVLIARRYLPREFTKEEAVKKVKYLLDDRSLTIQVVGYNRHGVALFGMEGDRPVVYWADPTQEKAVQVNKIFICTDGTDFTAETTHYDFHMKKTEGLFLNGEPATKLSLVEIIFL